MPEQGSTEATAAAPGEGDASGEGEKVTKVPAGVVPIFFSGAGQKIFGCVVDEDVTSESPNKLIPKSKIVQDFQNRAAVSDFHPIKKKVLVSLILYSAHPSLLLTLLCQ